MGISDRDYMRDSAENSSKRIRPRKKRAKNTKGERASEAL